MSRRMDQEHFCNYRVICVACFVTVQIHFPSDFHLMDLLISFLKMNLDRVTILWLIGQICPAVHFCK